MPSENLQYVNIPSLPVITPPLEGTEILVLVQAGIDRAVTLDQLKDYIFPEDENDYQSQINKLSAQMIVFVQNEPSTSDTYWVYDDEQIPYKVGQVVIYNDQVNNLLKFYAYRGLSGTDAVWQLLNGEGGGSMDLNKVNGKTDQSTGIISGTYAYVLMTLSADTTISCTGFSDGQEVQVLIVNGGSAAINVTIPATGDYKLLGYSADRVVNLAAGSDLELSVWYMNSKYRLKTIE